MTILIIRSLFNLLNKAGKKKIDQNKMDEDVKHPAEFGLR